MHKEDKLMILGFLANVVLFIFLVGASGHDIDFSGWVLILELVFFAMIYIGGR